MNRFFPSPHLERFIMEIIEQSHKIYDEIDGKAILKKLEYCARTCYDSYDKTCEGSDEKLVTFLIKHGHESVLEHQSITVTLVTDRAVLAELTRHRLASYSVQSQRYVRYDNIAFIKPDEMEEGSKSYLLWKNVCKMCAMAYRTMLQWGVPQQFARRVLPNSTATKIVITTNLREWRWIFKQRTSPAAHPDIRALLNPLLAELKEKIPIVFDDIKGEDDR